MGGGEDSQQVMCSTKLKNFCKIAAVELKAKRVVSLQNRTIFVRTILGHCNFQLYVEESGRLTALSHYGTFQFRQPTLMLWYSRV